jgi:hypothetical protein
MTQTSTLIAQQTITPADILAAAETAALIPVTGGEDNGNGGRYASFGGLVKITHEVRVGDPRGAWTLGATRGATYVRPGDVLRVFGRMVTEDREIFAVEAVRGAIGGTARV